MLDPRVHTGGARAVALLVACGLAWLPAAPPHGQDVTLAINDGNASLANGNWAAAIAAFEQALTTDPESAPAWLGLGRARIGAGSYPEALAALERAVETGLATPSVAKYHMARARAAMGESAAAITLLEELVGAGLLPYGPLSSAPEFAGLAPEPGYRALLDQLRPCNLPEHRQFDFWIGEWEVRSRQPGASGPPSRNRITPILDGCALLEEYQTAGAYAGRSLSFYDAVAGRWHQTWIDSSGGTLIQNGGFEDGRMRLEDAPGSNPFNRVTWTPLEDGRLTQTWERSADGGQTWTVVFDGIYSPVEAVTTSDGGPGR